MALKKQKINVPFTEGIQEKIDKKILPIGKFVELNNVDNTVIGAVKPRKAFEIIDGREGDQSSLSVFRGKQLINFEDRGATILDDINNEWVEISSGYVDGNISSTSIASPPVSDLTETYLTQRADVLVSGNLVYWSHGDYYHIQDKTTGALLVSNQSISDYLTHASAEEHNSIFVETTNYVWLVFASYISSNVEISAARFDPSDPTAAPTYYELTNDAASSLKGLFHATSLANNPGEFAISYVDSAFPHEIVIRVIDESAATTYSTNFVTDTNGTISAMVIVQDSSTTNDQLFVAWYEQDSSFGGLYRGIASYTGSAISVTSTTTVIDPTDNLNISTIVGAAKAATTDSVKIYFNKNSATTGGSSDYYPGEVYSSTLTFAGAVGSLFTVSYHGSIASVPFCDADNKRQYMFIREYIEKDGTMYSSALVLQDTATPGKTVGRCLVDRATNHIDRGASGISVESSGVYYFAAPTFSLEFQWDDGIATPDKDNIYYLNNVKVDFNKSYNSVEIGNNLIKSSMQMWTWDGANFVELGFAICPGEVDVTATATTGGNLTDGTYLYRFIYEWIDSSGQVYRSLPGPANTITFSGGTGTQNASISVPFLHHTNKDNIYVRMYRTEVGGTIYYSEDAIVNDPNTSNTADFELGAVHDDVLSTFHILYTSEGQLFHTTPGEIKSIISHNDRVFAVSGNNNIYYSNVWTEGVGIQFAAELKLNIGSVGGDITSLGSLDGNLVIGKEYELLRMFGDGANNLGVNNTFSIPQRISAEVGISDNQEFVNWNSGLMFLSNKGIYNLGRDFNTIHIGSSAETKEDLDYCKALLSETSSEIFFIPEGHESVLVYDTERKMFSTFDTPNSIDPVDAVIWKNKLTINGAGTGTPTYQIAAQYESTYDGTNPPLIETGWIRPGNLSGFSRLYRIFILGEVVNTTSFSITVYYEDESSETMTLSAQTAGELSAVVYPAQQKTRAFRIKIEQTNLQTPYQGAIITGLGLEVGIKKKLPFSSTKIFT